MRIRALFLVLSFSLSAFGQHLVKQDVFDAISNEYSGERAQENIRDIVEYHRIQGSPMMAQVAEQVVLAKLRAFGIESKLEQFPSDGARKYATFISPMGWDMRAGELWVEAAPGADFKPYRLCRYADVPMCVATYSKGGEWSGELVDVGSGLSDADYKDKDVSGKVALASGYAGNVVREAVLKHGAVGVVIYPRADDRPEHPYMVRYNGIWPAAAELGKTRGGFMISAAQYAQLHNLMKHGPVRVHGNIDATLGPGQLTLVHAWIRGSDKPDEEVLITGHLDHPKWSANDNASGSAAMIEMARTLTTLIKAGKVPAPRRTIHFMWVPEAFGTIAYLAQHPEVRRCGPWDDPRSKPAGNLICVLANLNMDMVGEDTVKTNGRFYFTRTPDSVPSFLDALMSDVLEQTREANLYAPTGTHNYWPTEIIPYAQGSDHDELIGIGVPATMLGHDPDWTHHTTEDTLDKTDASELLRVGTLASSAAEWMASADDQNWARVEARRAAGSEAAGAIRLNRISESREFDRMWKPSTDDPQGTTKIGPHRLTLLPIMSTSLENLSADDQKWWDEQEAKFAQQGEGLSLKPTFELAVFETVNYMDGHRSTKEIAGHLSAEYLMPIDQAWVDRLVKILADRKLVALPAN